MPGLPELIIGVTILALLAAAARTSRNRSSTLVLQQFSLSAAPMRSPDPTIEIVGRTRGIIAFTLSLMGFSPITRFTVAATNVRCESTSLSGQRSQFIPLRCVSTVSAGVHKPISSLVWATAIALFGVYTSFESQSWAPVAIALVIAAALIVAYFLTKKFFVEVHANGGTPISLLFTPNVIEGVPIDVTQALAVAAVIRDMVLAHGDRIAPAAPPNIQLGTDTEEPDAAIPDNAFQTPYDDDELADRLFEEARQFVQTGQRDLAVSVLQDIVRRFPDSNAASKAHRALQKSHNPDTA